MLIRTQEKMSVIPLQACSTIYIASFTERVRFPYEIRAVLNGNSVCIGAYKSEERAKEVLHDIILYESIMKAIELKVDVADVELGAFADMMFDCYDMPAE